MKLSSFKLPVVNIGTRQNGRLRALNVIDTGHNKLEISEAIERALNDSTFRNNLKHLINPYGEGNAAKRIVDVLEEIDINNKLLQKIIRY